MQAQERQLKRLQDKERECASLKAENTALRERAEQYSRQLDAAEQELRDIEKERDDLRRMYLLLKSEGKRRASELLVPKEEEPAEAPGETPSGVEGEPIVIDETTDDEVEEPVASESEIVSSVLSISTRR